MSNHTKEPGVFQTQSFTFAGEWTVTFIKDNPNGYEVLVQHGFNDEARYYKTDASPGHQPTQRKARYMARLAIVKWTMEDKKERLKSLQQDQEDSIERKRTDSGRFPDESV